MNSVHASIVYYLLKIFMALMRVLPVGIVLFIGRRIGDCAALSSKDRRKVFINLRIAFGGTKSDDELRQIMRKFYHSYGMNIVELARLPLIAKQGFSAYVTVDGREQVDAAIQKGRGVIFLSMHSGNWELANLVGSMTGHPYNMVANDMSRLRQVGKLINFLRQSGGARIINPGIGGRDIIRCLKQNEIVTLVADQGGREGINVPFFGRESSMSTGAVRLALKYDVPIVLVDIHRIDNGHRHHLKSKMYEVFKTGDTENDVVENLKCLTVQYEQWISDHPHEYLWPYKTWKYSKARTVVLLDDGRTGHLRQSQSVAQTLERKLKDKGFDPVRVTIPVQYRSDFHAKFFAFIAGNGFIPLGWNINLLRPWVSKESFAKLAAVKPDFVVSAGSRVSAVNYWMTHDNLAKSIHILRPGFFPFRDFGMLILPKHDLKEGQIRPKNVVMTNAAPNLIDKVYLDENVKGLLNHYSHLKMNLRNKMGVLIGGDTKGIVFSEQQIRRVIHQIKEISGRYNLELIVSTSRRTSGQVEQALMSEFKDFDRCALLIIANRANVPEAIGGILGLSTLVVVSGESISMVSEAASSGKKVVVFPVDGPDMKPLDNKYTRFVENLANAGYIAYAETKTIGAVIDATLKNKIPTRPVNDNVIIADALETFIQ
jgi:KDO2-lipid IV(A) lauroyltransferase